ncbi:MAG: hypothetical protein IPK83_17230 [Planctomycetes bacterium]|nr:hypothetical protein [Planctomycetota bacterium]
MPGGTGPITLGSDPLVGEMGTIEIPNGVTLTNFVTMNNSGAMRSVGALGVFGGTCTITGTGRFYGGLTATDTLRLGNVSSALSGSPGTLAIIEGPGTVQTNVANDYQGDWRIDSGTLRIGHSGGFGPGTTPVVVNSGGTLIVESGTIARPILVNDLGLLTLGSNLTTSADIMLSHSGDPLSTSVLGGGVFQLMLDGGNFTVDHGSASTGSGFVGFSPTSTAGASLSDDATWNLSGSLSVGHEGQGALSVASGSDVSNSIAHIGSLAGSMGSATVSGSGSTWVSSGFLGVGYSGTGTLNIENGGSVSAASSFVAADPGSSGEVNITGTGSTWSVTGSPVIGEHGDGLMTLTAGGTVADSGAFIGRFADGVGHVTVSGADSIWTNSGALIVGSSGTGTLGVEAGGRVTSTGDCQIGSSAGSDGSVTVGGAGSTFESGDLYVGFQGGGALSVLAGATATAADSSIGGAQSPEGSVATISGVGSNWTSSGELAVGDGGDGSLNIAAGGNVASGSSTIGRLNVGNGSATVTGTGSTWTNSNLAVGYLGGHGELSVLDGAVVTGQQGSVGNSNGTGNAVISGAGSTWNIPGALSLGFNGAGTLLVDSGGNLSTSLVSLGFGSGSTATATLSGAGSIWTCGVFGMELGSEGANGTLNVLGGTLTCNGDITDGGAGISTLTLDGGAIDMQNHAIGGVMPIDMLSFRSGALKKCNADQQRRRTTKNVRRHSDPERAEFLHRSHSDRRRHAPCFKYNRVGHGCRRCDSGRIGRADGNRQDCRTCCEQWLCCARGFRWNSHTAKLIRAERKRIAHG